MLVVIIVSWNVRNLLHACLQSLERYAATSHPQKIVVVDNASSDGSPKMVRAEFPAVLLVENNSNRGFTGGNNDGIRAADQLFSDHLAATSYIFLLNPDTVITPGALDALLAYGDTHQDVGLIGPQLRYPDGSIQSSRRRFPDLRTAIFESTWLQTRAPKGMLEAYYMLDHSDDEVCEVDWVTGAAMLVRRSTYLQCGLLDEATYFMYSEELDWCKRIKASFIPDADSQIWRILYLPQAQIIHYEAQSSQQVSAKRMIYFNTSKVRYFRKHAGYMQASLLRISLLGMFTYQLFLESVKWLAGHRRDLRAQRMRAYISVLRSGLR
jgi:N-acetylglucosaminyl-diphospho-decaprenol L-rhamnosyltransferase